MRQNQKLASNSLGIGDSIVMGLAGSAPAFSISAAAAALIASVHMLAPASMLYCGLLMFGITLAFIQLNKIQANAGASYAWVGEIFGPTAGFFTGWAILVASAVFMVSGSIPAATATLVLFDPELVGSMPIVSLVAALWVTLIAGITCKGIKTASYVQIIMTLIEVGILIAIIIAGFVYLRSHPAHEFSWKYFEITDFSLREFANGALITVFLYWGWDVTFNLNEE